MFKPSKEAVLDKFAASISPLPSAIYLLSYIGDKRVFQPFAAGEEPTWKEVMIALLLANPHISLDDVVAVLRNRDVEQRLKEVGP